QSLEKLSSQTQTFSRTKDFVASSAAALVSDRRYRETNFIRQQTISKSFNENDKSLILRSIFSVWLAFEQAVTISCAGSIEI
ncbi:hypothetical protein, partial [Rhizobium sp. Root149]|uniref:hypothetical protein n=1 Tax=Rhizobium sp. Root149 TaxID=1736473 RepID=UPI001AECAE41